MKTLPRLWIHFVAKLTRLVPAIILGSALAPTLTQAQSIFYVATVGNGTAAAGKISTYDSSGALINGNLISGLNYPYDLVATASGLFVLNKNAGSVDRYNLDGTGVTTLLSGLSNPTSITVTGSDLYVATNGNDGISGTIGKYTTSGAEVNASLISGLGTVGGIDVSGSSLYVMSYQPAQQRTVSQYSTSGGSGTVLATGLYEAKDLAVSGSNVYFLMQNGGLYDVMLLDTGTTSVSSFKSGINGATDVYISGTTLYVTSLNGNTTNGLIGAYSTLGGGDNATFISGLNEPYAVGLTAIPEPSACAALAGASVLGLVLWRRRSRRVGA